MGKGVASGSFHGFMITSRFAKIAAAVLAAWLCAGRCGADPEDATTPDAPEAALVQKTFAQLSERSVSRIGQRALAMTSVNWEHSESEHFIFHTEAGFSTPQLADAAEQYYAAIKADLGVTGDSFQRKSHIYVFLSEPAWRQFAASVNVEGWTGGFCTGRELFFQTRAHFRYQGTTLAHEMTHLAVYRFVGGDIPLWLNEGFAEFESTRLVRSYLKRRSYRENNLSAPVAAEDYVPLDALTGAVDYPSGTEQVKAFYAESQRLVTLFYDQGGGMPRLLEFMKLQSQGQNFDSAAREVYSGQFMDSESFERKFSAFATRP
jgi:hypothetical protein